MNIPIFTDEPGWQGQQLMQAFAARGVDATFVSLRDCEIDLSAVMPGVRIPGFDTKPQGAFVRGIAGGTMQQVITRLNVLHILSSQNVRIYNHVQAIERTVDKAMTSFLLRKHKVPTPKTWVTESRMQFEQMVSEANQHGITLVIKPLFGSQGQGVRRLLPAKPLPVPMQQYVDGVYYVQEYIPTEQPFHDYRLFVVGGKVIAAMKRIGETWVNNVASGARCEAVVINEKMSQLALSSAAALEIDYCGVDIIQAETGEYYVLEVNSIPAWRGLQGVTELNIAQALVDDFLDKLKT